MPSDDEKQRAKADFASRLDWCLNTFKAPDGTKWTNAKFSRAFPSRRTHRPGKSVNANTVGYWRNGTSLPPEIEPVLACLFGDNPTPEQATARAELRAAHFAARGEDLPETPAAAPITIRDNQV